MLNLLEYQYTLEKLVLTHRFKEAIALIKKHEHHTDAAIRNMGLYNLGIIHTLQNRYKEAEECFLKAIELDSEDFPSHLWLAQIYEKQNKKHLSIIYFEKGEAIRKRLGIARFADNFSD